MKQKTFLTADTETTGLGKRALVFDFAYVISTRNKIILERSFLVREILTNPTVMLGALFNEEWRAMFGGKIFKFYIPGIASQDHKIYSWREIVETLRDDMRTHNVDVFSAYNLPFDTKAMRTTHEYIGTPGNVLEYRPDLLCLWDFSCRYICNTRIYHEVAHRMGSENGWITPAGNVRTTAEKTFAFISGDHNFVEAHTALADAQIETEILQRLLAKKKRIPYNNADGMPPWMIAQKLPGLLI